MSLTRSPRSDTEPSIQEALRTASLILWYAIKKAWCLHIKPVLIAAWAIIKFEKLAVFFFGSLVIWMANDMQKLAKAQIPVIVTNHNILPKEGEPLVTDTHEINDVAPVGASAMTEEVAIAYINRFSKTAIAEMEKFGVPASISLAQGLVESRAGTSTLAVQNNNHFGIKCFARNCKKGHCTNRTDDSHKDFFRKFPSAWESWRAHSKMISTGRYAKLKKYGHDYKKWAYGLKSAGYATDRTYAEKLIGIIQRYKLQKYDGY